MALKLSFLTYETPLTDPYSCSSCFYSITTGFTAAKLRPKELTSHFNPSPVKDAAFTCLRLSNEQIASKMDTWDAAEVVEFNFVFN